MGRGLLSAVWAGSWGAGLSLPQSSGGVSFPSACSSFLRSYLKLGQQGRTQRCSDSIQHTRPEYLRCDSPSQALGDGVTTDGQKSGPQAARQQIPRELGTRHAGIRARPLRGCGPRPVPRRHGASVAGPENNKGN